MLWILGDGSTSSDHSPTHAYTDPGFYNVSLTVTGGGDLNTQARQDFVQVVGLGDVNEDGSVTLIDAVLALRTMCGASQSVGYYCDVDGDGKTGVAEAIYILHSVGIQP